MTMATTNGVAGTDLAEEKRTIISADDESMFQSPKARQVAKWCAYGVALALPGSFVILPLWLMRRHWASLTAWNAQPPRPPAPSPTLPPR